MESNESRLDFQRVTKESRRFSYKIADLKSDVIFAYAEPEGTSLHLHLHFGLPIAFHAVMVLTLPARAVQSGQWFPDLVLPSTHL
jgi:hypothetical protein